MDFAAGEKRAWLRAQGVKWVPNVGWAERGGYGAIGHGNSVPRFHLTWGTGPGVVEPFVRAARRRRVDKRFRHRVDALTVTAGAVDGVARHDPRAGRLRARASRPTARRSARSSCAPAR